jgi:hypothetical protein
MIAILHLFQRPRQWSTQSGTSAWHPGKMEYVPNGILTEILPGCVIVEQFSTADLFGETL